MILWLYSVVSSVIVTVILGLGLTMLARRKLKNSSTPLRKVNWEEDVVYLIQFPCVPKVRSISPFSLKVETWLRLNKIKYENIYSLKFGSKGQIPCIELNGKEIPDSNVILDKLEKHFKVPEIHNASKKSVAHAVTVMLENHTAKIGFYWRYGHHMKEFAFKVCHDTFPKKALKFWKLFQPTGTKVTTYFHGLGRHSLDEMTNFSCQDLEAISNLVSDKKFFHGEEASRIDCTIFGHLAQFLYIPMDFPQKKFLLSSCDNLVKYVDRVKELLWPDWEHMCTQGCMEGFMGKDYQDAIMKERKT